MYNDLINESKNFFIWIKDEYSQQEKIGPIPDNQKDFWRGYFAAMQIVYENGIWIRPRTSLLHQ